MAGSPATLSIKIVSDASDAAKDFQSTGRAASDMGDTVEAASRQVGDSSKRMDLAAEAADGMADKSSKATGALGALSSGFELVGLEAYAGGLQAAAMGTDFFSGVGDSLSLVMETQAGKFVKSTAATIKDTAAKTAASVASKAMAAAQWALNAAMAASPVLLIVAAVAALVAVVVLAYKRSETFRRIVDGAFKAVLNAARAAWEWIKSNWPLLLAIITGPIGLAVLAVVKNWDKIKEGAVAVKDRITEAFRNAKEFVVDAFDAMADKARAIGEVILAPFRAAIDLVEDLIGWIKKIDIPDFDIPFVGRSITGLSSGTTTTTTTAAVAPTTVIHLTVNGALDPMAVGRQIVETLSDFLRATGQTQIVIAA